MCMGAPVKDCIDTESARDLRVEDAAAAAGQVQRKMKQDSYLGRVAGSYDGRVRFLDQDCE